MGDGLRGWTVAAAWAIAGCGAPQGFESDPTWRAETWVQVEATPADVLWVVDSSCSMTDEQEELAANFPSFIEFFVESRLSFHVAVTSTNVYEDDSDGLDGRLAGDPPWLTEQTPDLAQAFLERALLGIDEGHGDEKGLHAAYVALGERGDAENAGFVREGANLAVIVVSDEMDFSETGEPGSEAVTSWEPFVAWLDGLKGEGSAERSQLSAIVGVGPLGFSDPDGCDGGGLEGVGAERGTGYLEAAEATGGVWQSICSEDWVELLGRLGVLVAGLEDTVPLTEVPLPGTLSVAVNGELTSDWTYLPDKNAVWFSVYQAVPPPRAEVRLEYHVAG